MKPSAHAAGPTLCAVAMALLAGGPARSGEVALTVEVTVAATVGEIAGTLRLELPGSGPSGVELRRGPARLHLDLLAPWAGYHGSRPDAVWELPAMEPGEYRLCRRGACEAGTLVPGATLVLRLDGDAPPPQAGTGG